MKHRALAAALAASLVVMLAASAHAALVPSVFNGRVPCLIQSGVQFCAGTLATRVETWDGVPLDVNVTIPPFTMDGPFPVIFDLHGWGVGKNPAPFVQQALDGYVVVSYSARGFHDSCGLAPSRVLDPTLANPNACNERGWIRLGDARYEARDTQYLAGRLVDEGLALPDKVGVTGVSYGGGQSMILAALKNRVMLPDGTLIPWQSPLGQSMQIAAAAPIVPWSDLAFSLVPNGRTLDYRAHNPYGDRGGVLKKSLVDLLYAVGLATGFYATPGVDPEADIQTWNARLNAGEPYDTDPFMRDLLEEATRHHSAYYIDDSIPPAPLFIYNAWTDDLFPATEALRFWRKTESEHPGAEIALQFADKFGHPRAALGGDMTTSSTRVAELFARHLKGIGGPLPALETYTQPCGGSTLAGPFSAADWDAIHPGEVRFTDSFVHAFGSAGGNQATADAVNPMGGNGTPCRTVAATDDPGAVTYRLPAVTGSGYTLMGSPTVIAELNLTGSYAQVAARLWDVAPDNTQALVSQSVYRPRNDNNAGLQVFQLHANGWRFTAGHVAKLELLGQSSPFARASNGTFTVSIKNMELRLPVLEAPNGLTVHAPAAPVLPSLEGEPPGCDQTPRIGCRPPAIAGKSKLIIKKNALSARNQLLWKWIKGSATSATEFGNPLATTGYALCLYDAQSNLLTAVGVPPGGVCDEKACWTATSKGYRYKDPDMTPMGAQKLDLREGENAKAKITLKAKGPRLDMPVLPIQNIPVTVQLVNGLGTCWETTLPITWKNSSEQFMAK